MKLNQTVVYEVPPPATLKCPACGHEYPNDYLAEPVKARIVGIHITEQSTSYDLELESGNLVCLVPAHACTPLETVKDKEAETPNESINIDDVYVDADGTEWIVSAVDNNLVTLTSNGLSNTEHSRDILNGNAGLNKKG